MCETRAATLSFIMSDKKNCFIICPIGEQASETRKRADQVLRHIITPAIEACGYMPVRADKISEPGLITSQVIQHIVDDHLVVADLTGMNPNVFYELAIRHAIRKPLVQIIQKGERIPFDVAGMRTIVIDHHDLDSVAEAKAEIGKQIKAVEGKKPEQIESPISASIELQTLRQSARPEDRTLAEIVSGISLIRAELAVLETKVSQQQAPIELPLNYLQAIFPSGTRQKDLRESRAELVRAKALSLFNAWTEEYDPARADLIMKEFENLREELRLLSVPVSAPGPLVPSLSSD